MQISVADITGRIVFISKFTGSTKFETQKLSGGLYYVIVGNKENTKTEKILVTN
jgi:hypothetical protein